MKTIDANIILRFLTVTQGFTEIYSFDKHFDKIKGVNRIEP